MDLKKNMAVTLVLLLAFLGHELDLASQEQNQKIISQVIASAKFQASARFSLAVC